MHLKVSSLIYPFMYSSIINFYSFQWKNKQMLLMNEYMIKYFKHTLNAYRWHRVSKVIW